MDSYAPLLAAGLFCFSLFYRDRKSTRLNSSHTVISYAVFCLKKTKLHEPLFELLGYITTTGKNHSREVYNLNSWVNHSKSDHWGRCNDVRYSGHRDRTLPSWA